MLHKINRPPGEQIKLAIKDLENSRGCKKQDTKDMYEEYAYMLLELANSQNLQRIADSLEKLASPVWVDKDGMARFSMSGGINTYEQNRGIR